MLSFACLRRGWLCACSDQTLTSLDQNRQKQLRGGEESRRFLEALHQAGVPTVVVTATKPSVDNTHSIAHELEELGLAHIFEVHKPDTSGLEEMLRGWGPNEEIGPAKLTLKLALLLALHTDRKVHDLPRWAHAAESLNVVAADGDSVAYKLWQAHVMEGGSSDHGRPKISGPQTLTVSRAWSLPRRPR